MALGDIVVTVGISGSLTGAGNEIADVSESKTFSSIADVVQRELTVPTSVITALTVGAVAGGGLAALNCLFLSNLDASNFVNIGLIDDGAKAVYFKLEAGESILLCSGSLDTNVTGGVIGTLTNIDTLTMKADTAAVKVQMVAF